MTQDNRVEVSHLAVGVHLMGYRCARLRALDALQASHYMPSDLRIEFVTTSHTNPKKVTCSSCWAAR